MCPTSSSAAYGRSRERGERCELRSRSVSARMEQHHQQLRNASLRHPRCGSIVNWWRAMVPLLLLLAGLASAVRHSPEPKPHALNGWHRVALPVDPLLVLTVHVALTRPFGLTSALYAVSDPAHPHYGRHWDWARVRARTAPPAARVLHVRRELAPLRCRHLSGHADWLECEGTVAELERVLQCRFRHYAHAAAPGRLLPRAPSYSLPASLRGVVDLVAGVKRLPPVAARPKLVAPALQGSVTPQRTRALYNVTVRGSATNGNLQEVAQFMDQYVAPSDMAGFWALLRLPPVNVTIHGPNDASQPGTEAMLDVETITGVNQGTPTWATITPGLLRRQEPFLAWLLGIAGTAGAPKVHSVSYADVEESLDVSCRRRRRARSSADAALQIWCAWTRSFRSWASPGTPWCLPVVILEWVATRRAASSPTSLAPAHTCWQSADRWTRVRPHRKRGPGRAAGSATSLRSPSSCAQPTLPT